MGPAPWRTRFRACWDRDALHVRFDAEDSAPWHTMNRRDDHIWEEEVVELFLDADGSGLHYAELEISPANVVCDLDVATPWPHLKSLTAWDWDGLTSTVHPWKEPGSGPGGWTAVARLPWTGLRSLYPGPGRWPSPRPEARPGSSTSSASNAPGGPPPVGGRRLCRLVEAGGPEFSRPGGLSAPDVPLGETDPPPGLRGKERAPGLVWYTVVLRKA